MFLYSLSFDGLKRRTCTKYAVPVPVYVRCSPNYLRSIFSSRVTLSQDWLPTVQLVLQADWQVLLHSPQPVTFFSAGFAIVLIIAKNLLCFFRCLYYNTLFTKLQAVCDIFLLLSSVSP